MNASSDGGIYTLVLEVATPLELTVGSLGSLSFDAGHYAYVGSALGPGGFSRIDRHRELDEGTRAVRHWHIDYLLGHSESAITDVYRSPGFDDECAIARAITAEEVPGFGCTDCACSSHLFVGEMGELGQVVETAHSV